MKKFLFIALFIAGFASIASAQEHHDYSEITYIRKKIKPVEPGYQSTVGVSFALAGDNDSGVLLFEYIGGHRFNNTVFLGGGAGLGFSVARPRLGHVSHEYQYYYGEDEVCNTPIIGSGFAYRLFVNGRFYLSKTRLQPFLGAAIGFEGYKTETHKYASCKYRDEDIYNQYHKDRHKAGFYAMPEVGLNYRISDRASAFFSIGYGAAVCGGALQIKLGATF